MYSEEEIKEQIYKKIAWFPREKTLNEIFNSATPFTELYKRARDHDGASRETLRLFRVSP